MPESNEKLVHFHEYCHACTHRNKKENEEPCDKCLGVGARLGSHKPVNFKARAHSK